jgi:hypothetical protein
MGQNAIAGAEADFVVQRKVSAFDQVQRGESEGSFEDGLHRRMRVWIEIAIERGARQRARDGYLAVSFARNRGDL